MTNLIPLSYQTLRQIPAGISHPGFAPQDTRTGIVHLGLGNFHRAHMARYTHDLMEIRPDSLEWGIAGVGLMPNDRRMLDALGPQDGLYTLIERQGDVEFVRVVGSIREVLFAGESSRCAVESILRSGTRIVSLTVTEHGYCLNPVTKTLNFDHPSIVHDLLHPETPCSAIGIIVEAYRRLMLNGSPAFTSLTCDNIQHNGVVLKNAVLDLAYRRDSKLSRWIETAARFPSTMVDRITPMTTRSDIDYLESQFGLIDRWPVVSEVFSQWVIEDSFPQGRPDWDLVGAQFVDDVSSYEFMKLRLLNASHLAIAGLGRLAGYTFIDQTLRDADIRAYMQALMDRETGPTVPPIPGIDLGTYKSQLLDRFSNAKIKDTLDRVNTDAPINLLIDPIVERLNEGTDITLLSLGLAAWMRRVRGEDEHGHVIAVIHPQAPLFKALAEEGGSDPRPLLSIESLFGALRHNAAFVSTLERWLGALYTQGAKATLGMARREMHF